MKIEYIQVLLLIKIVMLHTLYLKTCIINILLINHEIYNNL
nr:MAG TPA: hypothetical protein [Bacteriophage sp.]